MDNDRELLELAAKAAGIEYDIEASKPHPKSNAWFGLWLVIHGEPSEYQRRHWNPLTNDGDALRLAVKCRISFYVAECLNSVEVGYFDDNSLEWFFIHEDFEKDQYAATRRAIVRAAAEIGKAMV